MANLGHPSKFQLVSRLGSVTARHSSGGRQPNFAALNRWRHLYSASRWALDHTSIVFLFVRTITEELWLDFHEILEIRRLSTREKLIKFWTWSYFILSVHSPVAD